MDDVFEERRHFLDVEVFSVLFFGQDGIRDNPQRPEGILGLRSAWRVGTFEDTFVKQDLRSQRLIEVERVLVREVSGEHRERGLGRSRRRRFGLLLRPPRRSEQEKGDDDRCETVFVRGRHHVQDTRPSGGGQPVTKPGALTLSPGCRIKGGQFARDRRSYYA